MHTLREALGLTSPTKNVGRPPMEQNLDGLLECVVRETLLTLRDTP
jgi:hypothetical protein